MLWQVCAKSCAEGAVHCDPLAAWSLRLDTELIANSAFVDSVQPSASPLPAHAHAQLYTLQQRIHGQCSAKSITPACSFACSALHTAPFLKTSRNLHIWWVSASVKERMAICMLLSLEANAQGRQELWRDWTRVPSQEIYNL